MKTLSSHRGAVFTAIAAFVTPVAWAQSATFEVKVLAPETAMSAARGALEHCRRQGFQVAVAVVDRSGVLQAFIRDRFAGVHTVEAANNKAWTAASFRVPSATLGSETQAGKSMSGLRALTHVMAVSGGQPIEGGGGVLGAIGVSGAPGGEADDACAKAGIQAIAESIEF